MSNLHEPVGAGEERELITIFYSPQKIVIVIQHRCHHEEKTPKNRLTETLEPLNQNIGAPNLSVAIKPILSVLYSSWLLSTHTRSRNQNSTIHITLLLQLNAAQKILVHFLHGRYDGLVVSLKSREMCFSHGIRSRIDCFFFCHK